MNEFKVLLTGLSGVSVLLGGCAIGFDHTLFATKSNIGLDVDTKPPTAEISIARRELVIAPTFEGGQTPPVLAGFRTGNRLFFGFDVASVFAGGDAAAELSAASSGGGQPSKLCLQQKPEGKPHLGPIPLGTYPLPEPGGIRPFVFGTDTTFGLKVAWSGMTAQFPDSFKLGFNRKELALAPVFGREHADQECPYSVEMPPFLASIETAAAAASPQSVASTYRQSFSTGAAAVELASDPYVKRLLLARLDRGPEHRAYGADRNSECINRWLLADETQKKARADAIDQWWQRQGHDARTWPELISAAAFAVQRAQFIKDNAIPCDGG